MHRVLFSLLALILIAGLAYAETEIPGLRTQTSKTYNMGAGQFRLLCHSKPVHYKDKDGKWADIVLDLDDKADKYIADKNTVTITFWKHKKLKDYASLECGDTRLQLSMVSIELDGQEKVTGDSYESVTKAEKNKVLHQLPTGIEIVTEFDQAAMRGFVRVSAPISQFSITEQIDVKKLECSNQLDNDSYVPDVAGCFNFVDDESNLIFRITPPYFVDAAGVYYESVLHELKIVQNELLYTKSSTDSSDLSAAPYPILIDTSTFYSSTSDGYVYNTDAVWSTCRNAATGSSVDSNDSSYSAAHSATGAASFHIRRSFYYFDTSSLPDDCTITDATLKLYGMAYAESNVSAQKGTQADPLTTADYDSFTGSEYGHVSWATGQYNSIVFNATGRGDIDKTGVTKVCCREYDHDYSDVSPGSNSYRNGVYYTEETGTDKDPKLEVTYPGGAQVIIVH